MMNTPGHNIVLKNGAPRQPPSLGSTRGRVRSPFFRHAFTLVEIMVTVALLAIIILGLVAMFNQTRRAFTSSLAQVDVLESGRGTGDMITRDVEQAVPAYIQGVPNFYVITSGYYTPLIDQLANPTDVWTNVVQEFLFLTPTPPNNGQWTAIGYRLQTADESNSIGSLYRYYLSGFTIANNVPGSSTNFANLTRNFITTAPLATTTNFNRIIDGVTYFRVLAYKTNGVLITNGNFNLVNSPQTIQVRSDQNYPGLDYSYIFTSNALPAYVEIELGILETAAFEKYRSFGPGTAAANNYLTSHPGAVHIFRQRIPIRDVDPSTVFP
jgi:prepilin-type N-terminal cleavage/methylation domain-containing protein